MDCTHSRVSCGECKAPGALILFLFFPVRCQPGEKVKEQTDSKYKKLKKALEDAGVAVTEAEHAVDQAAPGSNKQDLRSARNDKAMEKDAPIDALDQFMKEAPKGWAPPVVA